MKQVCKIIVLGAAIMLAGCGSSSHNNINGNWTATLASSNATNILLTLSLSQSSSNSLSVSNIAFSTGSACFSQGASGTGSFTASGNTGGNVSGTLQLTIQASGSTDQLSLQGTLNNNTINGSWTLSGTGAGCTGSGTFVMTKQ